MGKGGERTAGCSYRDLRIENVFTARLELAQGHRDLLKKPALTT